ncbi:hypothetical protein H6P81_008002 [Aristolochia fimbriata]|uniref:peptidylprolyl isomerase n=1 Tax=Aristolochia fimbriata TaxID=158543 RepID=A0AAV7F245_ARIFI|nr:hypothetical protein H6P81_008002 [Aristolochia fimbriata]
MAFWGIELKPTQSFTHHFSKERGRLHISQATLGWGASTKKSVLQCNIGNKSPVLLCSLLPEKVECCPLNLEFEEAEEVTFSIVGPRSVHLTGYYLHSPTRHFVDKDSESESFGEDIGDTDTERSSDHTNDEYEDDFIDDNEPEVLPPSPVSDEVKESAKRKSDKKRLRRKYLVSDSDGNDASSPQRIRNKNGVILSSEDEEDDHFQKKDEEDDHFQKKDEEDDCPISFLSGSKNSKIMESEKGSNPTIPEDLLAKEKNTVDDDRQIDTGRKNETQISQDQERTVKTAGKKKKKKKEKGKEGIVELEADMLPKEADRKHHGDEADTANDKIEVIEQTGKLKRKRDGSDDRTAVRADDEILGVSPREDQESKAKLSHEQLDVDSGRTAAKTKKKKSRKSEIEQLVEASKENGLSNELVIEDLQIGQPDGKVASHGNKVAVLYSGMVKDNGHVFDSNVGAKPYKFRLGKTEKQDDSSGPVNQWLEAAVTDMRVGGKRRLLIPPSKGYGAEGRGEIPGNAWLQYDVELVNVK